MVSIFMINSCFVVVCLIFLYHLSCTKICESIAGLWRMLYIFYLWKNIIACKDEMKNRSSQDLGSIKIIKYSSNASVYYAWRVCSTLPILFLHFLEIHLFMKIFGVKGHAGDKKMCPLGMDRLSVPPR